MAIARRDQHHGRIEAVPIEFVVRPNVLAPNTVGVDVGASTTLRVGSVFGRGDEGLECFARDFGGRQIKRGRQDDLVIRRFIGNVFGPRRGVRVNEILHDGIGVRFGGPLSEFPGGIKRNFRPIEVEYSTGTLR